MGERSRLLPRRCYLVQCFHWFQLSFAWLLHGRTCVMWFRASGRGREQLRLLRQRMSSKRSFSSPWGRYWPCKSCWNTTRHHASSSCKDFSKIFYPEMWRTNSIVPGTIVNSFPSSPRIALIYYFPLEATVEDFYPFSWHSQTRQLVGTAR